MLKTNSRQARENIRQYIIDNFSPETYTDEVIEGFENVALFILDTFTEETKHHRERRNNIFVNEEKLFTEWASGLPSVLDTCYYYNRSAIEDLGNILEETEEERNKYTEAEAEALLTHLIYRELDREAYKHYHK